MDPLDADPTLGPSGVATPMAVPVRGQADVGTAAGSSPASPPPPGYGGYEGAGAGSAGPPTYNPGDIIATDFKIESKLGAGGMGVVYRARHLILDRTVALKIHRSNSPDDSLRVEREAKAMARFEHPNVISVYDVRRDGDALIIAMEYLDGGTLRDQFAHEPSWRRKLEHCLRAGDGLAAAHRAGLVHRDFKPDNVLLGRDGRVVVADFGLARAPGRLEPQGPSAGTQVPTPSDLDADLTATGAVLGTPAYMAPEQFEGANVDAAADQFAFAVVLYEALYGRRPFPGRSAAELLYSVTTGALIMPPEETDVPSELWDAIRKGLTHNPAARHPNLARMLATVRAILGAPARRTLRLAVGLAAIPLVVVAAVAYVMYGHFTTKRNLLTMVHGFDGVIVKQVFAAPHPEEVRAAAEGAAAGRTKAMNEIMEPVRADLRKRLQEIDPNENPAEFASLIGMIGDDADGAGWYLGALLLNPKIHGAPDPGPIGEAKPGEYPEVAWDGHSTLTCGMNQKMTVRGVKAKVETGVAIDAQMNCKIRIIDCDIEAPTIVGGKMPLEVLIDGGTFTAVDHLAKITMARNLHIRGVTLAEPTGKQTVLLDGSKGYARIEDSRLEGPVALETKMHARVEVVDSQLVGHKHAIVAGMHSKITLERSETEGPLDIAQHASVSPVKEKSE